jgi:adenosylhomocysteinase
MDQRRLESINIINALRRGTVPASGLERIAVGLDVEEGVISRQLDYVAQSGGDLKFIRGDYGSGKTFLVARALEIARTKGFVTSHVIISAATRSTRSKASTSRSVPTSERAAKSMRSRQFSTTGSLQSKSG